MQSRTAEGDRRVITSDGSGGIVSFREKDVVFVGEAQDRVGGVCANIVDSLQNLLLEGVMRVVGEALVWLITSFIFYPSFIYFYFFLDMPSYFSN